MGTGGDGCMAEVKRDRRGLFQAYRFTVCPVSSAGPLKILKVSDAVRRARLAEIR